MLRCCSFIPKSLVTFWEPCLGYVLYNLPFFLYQKIGRLLRYSSLFRDVYKRQVEPLSLAAMAVGADGLIIEVHNCPEKAWCDGAQSLNENQFNALMNKMRAMGANVDRKL